MAGLSVAPEESLAPLFVVLWPVSFHSLLGFVNHCLASSTMAGDEDFVHTQDIACNAAWPVRISYQLLAR